MGEPAGQTIAGRLLPPTKADAVTLLLIDSSYLLHRSAAVMPDLVDAQGAAIGGVFGFVRSLWGYLTAPASIWKISHIAAVFDIGGRTWRHDTLDGYKANRSGSMDGQRREAMDACRALNVTPLAEHGVEADDIIATMTFRARLAGVDVVIVSPDKDIMQLVETPVVRVWNPANASMMDSAAVNHRYGVWPQQIPDYLALVGDTADNVPGVPGIGPKKAAAILGKHMTIEGWLEAAPPCFSADAALVERLKLARHIHRLNRYIQIGETIDDVRWRRPDMTTLFDYLAKHGMDSLGRRIGEEWTKLQEERPAWQ